MLRQLFNHCSSIVCLIALISFTTSCEDKNYFDGNYVDTSVGEKPSDLSFSTSRDVKFNFNYEVPTGFISQFEIYAENPFEQDATTGGWFKRDGLTPLTTGIYVAGTSNITRTIPAHATKLYAYSPNLFAPVLMSADIQGSTASFSVWDTNAPIKSDPGTRSVATGGVDFYLKQGSDFNGAYKPSIDKRVTFPVEVMNKIVHTFPEDQTLADEKYYTDASVELLQEGSPGEGIEVFLSVINSAGTFNNSLSYFCYDGPKSDLPTLSEAQKSNLKVITAFQYAKIDNNDANKLQAGDYLQLKYWNGTELVDKFPPNVTIGWILSSNAFNVDWSTGSANYFTRGNSDSYPWFYSVQAWNPEKNNKNHTIQFSATDNSGKNYICFGFEDAYNEAMGFGNYVGDRDCNDVMFHIITNPANAITPPPTIEVGELHSYETKKGIVAFEDNWPKKGDYDMNDVVVKYNSDITYIQKTKDGKADPDIKQFVSTVEDQFALIHSGANFRNSFSVKYPIPYANVESVKVTMNGTDDPYEIYQDEDSFVLHLCELVSAVIPVYTIVTDPKIYTVNIKFKEGTVLSDEFNSNPMMHAPYNPYISPFPYIQVHLPHHTPVWDDAMNANGIVMFGTSSDRSRVKDENDQWQWTYKWYVSGDENPYPFAINLVGATEYAIPKESNSIDKAYPDYMKWVNSGCTEYTDWYLNPGSGVEQ